MKLVFIGNDKEKEHFSNLVFRELQQERNLGKKFLWLVPFIFLLHKNAEMFVIEAFPYYKKLFHKRGDFLIPSWLECQASIPLQAKNRSAKEDLRHIRKNKLSYFITSEKSQCQFFYENLYLPTVRDRHRARAVIMGYGEMWDKISQGTAELLLVKMGEDIISGVLIVLNEAVPRLWSNGVLNGDINFSRKGGIAATYYFSAQYLAEKGYTAMHVGSPRSFLNDGGLQLKKKWGASFSVKDSPGYILKCLNFSTAVRSFLRHNPFSFVAENELYAALFVDDNGTEEEMVQWEKKYRYRGLKKIKLFQLKDATGLQEL